MFKEKAMRGLICLLAIMLAGKGWAAAQEATQGTEIPEAKKLQLEKYVSREILFISWGSGEGEVGLKVTEICVQGIATETVRYGPSKIELDKNGNIFIFDGINQRVQKYSKEGKRLSSVSLSKVEKKPFLIDKFRSSYHYRFYRDKDDKAIIEIRDSSNKLHGKIEYEEYYKYPFAIDMEGNVYVLWDTTIVGCVGPGDEEWKLELHKYSKEGNPLAKIKLVDDFVNKLGERDKVKVDKDGNIYQLLCNTEDEKDGLHILKWEMK